MKRNPTQTHSTAPQYRQTQGHVAPMQVYRGKQNQKAAGGFEKHIIAACDFYEDTKVAMVRKTPEPMRLIKHLENGKFISVYDSTSEPTFRGTMFSGQSVVFEAMYTETDRIERKQLTLRQEEFLESYYKMHAIVFVLIGFSDDRCYRIPWPVWKNMQDLYMRKYLMESDVAAYEVTSNYINGKRRICFLDKHAAVPVLTA